ncbi:type II secretion system protein GspM [Marinomonas balearica]|uniref:General secretion pathway protein M n=1 Tax=Marinomonas balearica TaxID=491947 RepID=A0A4R6MBV0_9GAMM|nr:type II secretion system protein GspM [Marinomonas balearica]TDO98170.1 general secretion pathway protein M [Marinomonas balearica]
MKQWLVLQFQSSPTLMSLWLQFQRRSLREQWLVIVATISLLVLTAFYGVWQPAKDQNDRAQSELKSALEHYQTIVKNAEKLASLNTKNGAVNFTDRNANQLRALVNSASKRAGLVAERISAENATRLQIWASNASFTVVSRWLRELARERVRIDSLQIESVSAGKVNLRVTLD